VILGDENPWLVEQWEEEGGEWLGEGLRNHDGEAMSW